MFLDLCHTLQQFVAPLPEDYDEFKALINSTFPKIIDTKLMATTSPLREEIFKASLDELLKTVSQAPFKLPKVETAKVSVVFFLHNLFSLIPPMYKKRLHTFQKQEVYA